ncbi:MAG: ACP S-malonyltransferase [Deltaproteobacteria bacterium]|nr:ACP S-malonyltransferase [Deltaproteobacteria bacterium]
MFPGQGSQKVEMGKWLCKTYPQARSLFEEASDTLGKDLYRLCVEGPASELDLTENAQPAILTVSVAAHAIYSLQFGKLPDFVLGHSLGEYSALVVAGVLRFRDAVKAVSLRGRWMQEAVPPGEGSMVAVMGLPEMEVREICLAVNSGRIVVVANVNGENQMVLSGHRDAVEEVASQVQGRGARTRSLPVSAPFHSPLMRPAETQLRKHLEDLRWGSAQVRWVSNVDAQVYQEPQLIREKLIEQVCAPVRFKDCVGVVAKAGVEQFVELGAGRVLSGLVRRIVSGAQIEQFGDGE